MFLTDPRGRVAIIGGCCSVTLLKFWEMAWTYKWSIFTLSMQVKFCGHSEVVGTVNPYLLQSKTFTTFIGFYGDKSHYG